MKGSFRSNQYGALDACCITLHCGEGLLLLDLGIRDCLFQLSLRGGVIKSTSATVAKAHPVSKQISSIAQVVISLFNISDI